MYVIQIFILCYLFWVTNYLHVSMHEYVEELKYIRGRAKKNKS